MIPNPNHRGDGDGQNEAFLVLVLAPRILKLGCDFVGEYTNKQIHK